MKHLIAGCICACILISTASSQTTPVSTPPTLTPDRSSAPIDPGWPREIERDGYKLTYQQPQIEEWTGFRKIKARVAFTLAPTGGTAVLGIADLEGATVVNRDKRSVFIEKLRITDARFPSLSENEAAAMEAQLKRTFPAKGITLSLDRLLSGVERSKEAFRTVELKMEAPPIFSSTTPAVLLMVQGAPVLAPAGESGLQFVVNTNWDLFFDPATQDYYLLADKVWLTAKTLSGEWTLPAKLPDTLKDLPKDWAHVKASLPFKATKGMTIPKVCYSEIPAELIAFQGAPVWAKIPETKLSWANNSDNWIFKQDGTNTLYFLVSGRWFSAPSLDGPWRYAGNDLPEDFSRIPDSHPCADVLASVPGSDEAADAVLLAQIPVEAIVKKAGVESKISVSYEGQPEFVPIANSSVSYAKNTSFDVLKIKDQHYLCQDAVWFVSNAADGPWKVCTDVPPEVYSIPPSSPVYRVSYVKTEEGSNSAVAVSSYTSGYLGSYVANAAAGAALVWGTGWYYPPYVSSGAVPIFRPYYATYGGAAAYNPWTGGYAVGQRYYGPYANAGRAAWYNPSTGSYARGATVQGAYGGRTLAAGYNPRSDTAWSSRQGNSGYAQWGTSAVQRGDDWVRAWHVQTEEGGVARVRTEDGKRAGVAVQDDNLYAGRDGNLYRRDGDGWVKYEEGDWAGVNSARNDQPGQRKTAKTQPGPDTISRLENDAWARSRGSVQTSRQMNYERSGNRMGGSRGVATGSGGRGRR